MPFQIEEEPILLVSELARIPIAFDVNTVLECCVEDRGRGIGSALLHSAGDWATRKRCRQLKVETQNTNVPACRFSAKHGFTLGAMNRFAYPIRPEEIQLLWYKELTPG